MTAIDITQVGYYNITKLLNTSSLGNLMSGIAPVMGGYYLGYAFLLIIFFVSYLYTLSLAVYNGWQCFMASMSLTMIGSILLFSMEMIDSNTLWLVVFGWLFAFGALLLTDN